jgi:hypothetical protein
MRNPILRSTLAAIACGALLAACGSDSTGANAHRLSVSFTTHAKSSTSSASGINASLTVTNGGNTLVINKAQVVLSRIEVTTSSTAACPGDDEDVSGQLVSSDGMGGGGTGEHHGDECNELRADPAVVSLPTDASVTTSVVSTVPAGTYTDFEAKVRPVMGTSPTATAFLTANPTFDGVSAHVEGTYNGTPFTYDGAPRGKLELAFDPPLTVDASGLNITVNVDLASWFTDGSGGLIDPSTANSGGANEMLVRHNIHESFEAFEDEDHDGHDDHGHDH